MVRQVGGGSGANNGSSLTTVLQRLNSIMDGYRRSFEYIQDYIGIYGLKIWHEELSRIVAYNVEIECHRFLKSKIRAGRSIYQDKIAPIPDFPRTDFSRDGRHSSVTFIGRLLAQLIRLTDPR